MEIKLSLTVDDVNTILQVLGDLPTKLGLWPLALNIKQQAEAQLPTKEETTDQQ